MNRTIFSLVVLAATAFVISSCGPSGRKPVYPVRGVVKFNNAPAHRALVIFHPVGDTDPQAIKPRGEVSEDGSFKLSTFGNGDGAPEGEYLVTVEWWLASGKPGDDNPPSNWLPAHYALPERSGLKAKIIPGSNELQPFELKR